MVLGRDTFAGDLLTRLGVLNVYARHPDRYPRVDIAELAQAGADLVVLPDEPYRFTASDGPEAFPGQATALVSGRHLTWYGPSLTEAPAVLARMLNYARDFWAGKWKPFTLADIMGYHYYTELAHSAEADGAVRWSAPRSSG